MDQLVKDRKKVSEKTVEEGLGRGKESNRGTTGRHQAASCNASKSRVLDKTT